MANRNQANCNSANCNSANHDLTANNIKMSKTMFFSANRDLANCGRQIEQFGIFFGRNVFGK